MTMSHDYAGCAVEPCVRCQDYGLGWSHGKVKMRDEIVAAAAERRHAADCGCVPCAAARASAPLAAAHRAGVSESVAVGRRSRPRLPRLPAVGAGRDAEGLTRGDRMFSGQMRAVDGITLPSGGRE